MTFEELGINEPIRLAIEELGFAYPMPIQETVIPKLLNEQHNIIALAQTGTGKTATYGLPIVQTVSTDTLATQSLILSPTRELCLQIADDLHDFAKHLPSMHVCAVYGGAGMEQQMRQLKRGVHVIVATPGRLIDLMHRGYVNLSQLQSIVLDEADEMLNMGFQESIEEVMAAVPADCRRLMFSATMSREVEKVAKGYMGQYETVVVGSRNEGAENVNHIFYLVHAKDKYLALKRIVDYHPKIFAIIFCRTKLETQEIADKLIKDGYNAESLHGDLSQPQRDQTMQKFRQHLTQLLVATDVAARGLDVDDLTHVINYALPDDVESYTHRSGRTGRAGKNGTSISIIHTRERHKVREIEKIIGKSFIDGQLPSPQEICTKQLYKAMDHIMKMDVNEEEIAPFMDEINRHFEFIDKEDLLKKIVSMTFGRFLSYYADAPEIEKPATKAVRAEERKQRAASKKGPRKAEEGYQRLFINLGKDNGFYPGEVMQFLNKHLGGKQKVGHIDLYGKFAYIEIPEEDAEHVMATINGTRYRGLQVRCNEADDKSQAPHTTKGEKQYSGKNAKGGSRANAKNGGSKPTAKNVDRAAQTRSRREVFGVAEGNKSNRSSQKNNGSGRRGAARKDDWRQFFEGGPVILRGDKPDFSEEGWARRKPKKK